MFLKLGYLETLWDLGLEIDFEIIEIYVYFSDPEGSLSSESSHNNTYCLCKIWSGIIIIIVPRASIFPITMANMSWVITVSRDGDGDDGDGCDEKLRVF